jgi:hypothetical protein
LAKVCKASSVSTVILTVFAEMPVAMIVDALIILALVTLIDAAQSGLYLCHVAEGIQGKLIKHCHSRCFCRNACDNNSGCTYYTCPDYLD